MLKKWLAGIMVCSSIFGAGNVAAEAEKIDFDQGKMNVNVDPLPAETGKKSADQNASAWTFQVSSDHKVHAKGLKKKDLPDAYWQSSETSQVYIPNALDLRPQLTQIEDQGKCGSCWAFSLTATNRDGHALGGTDPGRLSQEWLVENSPEAAGCYGGYFDSANDLITPKGQPLWEACPYQAGSGKCPADLALAAHITGWRMLGKRGKGPKIRDIETYMARSGKPVSIAVAAGSGPWEHYASGIYNGCTAGPMDHMINIVGWDNEGATFDKHGNLPPGKGIWILRNSWGESWGESGYMRTKMTDVSGKRCNAVAQEAAYFKFE